MPNGSLLSQLLEAERRAQGISLDAVEQQQGLEEELAAKVAGIHDRYAQQTQQRLEKLRQDNAANTQIQLDKLNSHYTEKLQQMDAIYAAEKDNWVETLFARIIAV